MIRSFIFSVHRALGAIFSLLFLIWFLSGFVMLYHRFPRVSIYDKALVAESIPSDLPSIDSVLNTTELAGSITKLELRTYYGEQVYRITTTDSVYQLTPQGLPPAAKPTYTQVEAYAKRWCDADIKRMDTLRELDQWIPFSRLKKEFPIYKIYFADSDEHQLYLSSKTGEALQFTDKHSRFWSWLGAIPHWVYLTSLRENAETWTTVMTWLSGLGSIMCLTGIVAGIWVYGKRYRAKRRWQTPYKKTAYKWHHTLGFVFGFFTLTFVFSGMMSLVEVPDWIAKTHSPQQTVRHNMHRTTASLSVESYGVDYRKLVEAYPNQIKSIEWSMFGSLPTYKVMVADSLCVFDASGDSLKPLELSAELVKNRFTQEHSEPITVSLMTEYDSYYLHRKRTLPLPVYKVEVNDADKSVYYVDVKTGESRYYNRKSRVHKWMYQALHSFNIKLLTDRPVLWSIVMWTTMIGGTLLSATGVWLGYKWVRKKTKWLKKRIGKK